MSRLRQSTKAVVRRRPPHRVIIARGEHIRTFTIRPWLIGTVVMVAILVTAGYLGATGYLMFRDDVLATSIARQTTMEHEYEDRIAALRADIDRLTSRQLLNQQEVDAEVQKLVSRQATISERQDALRGLNDAARAVGIATSAPPAPLPAQPTAPTPVAKPSLKTGSLVDPTRPDPMAALRATGVTSKPALARMSEVEADIDRVAGAQIAYVDAFATSISRRNDQIATVLKGIGQNAPAPRALGTGIGGPDVPTAGKNDPAQFKASIALVKGELDRYRSIREMTARLPLTAPVAEPSVSSGFGPRIDPFLGTPAQHTGVDFRALLGTPVGATAAGVVIAADTGNNGGYGNMVDIDHGNGIVTRFGHLSEITVKVGQVVAKGTIIGRAGSTGRATGPHLHYEVRIDDDPIDPTRFLSAGEKLSALL